MTCLVILFCKSCLSRSYLVNSVLVICSNSSWSSYKLKVKVERWRSNIDYGYKTVTKTINMKLLKHSHEATTEDKFLCKWFFIILFVFPYRFIYFFPTIFWFSTNNCTTHFSQQNHESWSKTDKHFWTQCKNYINYLPSWMKIYLPGLKMYLPKDKWCFMRNLLLSSLNQSHKRERC